MPIAMCSRNLNEVESLCNRTLAFSLTGMLSLEWDWRKLSRFATKVPSFLTLSDLSHVHVGTPSPLQQRDARGAFPH